MKKKEKRYPVLNALKGRIREKGTSYRRLAEEIGIEAVTLNNKINGYYPMNAEEMEQIATVLEIAPGDVARFFMPTYCETHHAG